jgi:hypothetical protein
VAPEDHHVGLDVHGRAVAVVARPLIRATTTTTSEQERRAAAGAPGATTARSAPPTVGRAVVAEDVMPPTIPEPPRPRVLRVAAAGLPQRG